MKIEYQEEMFTTKQAQRNLIEKGVKGIKKFDDQEAARIILQGWLDKKK
jgi:RNase H-fold protein (predicted Holliday junction resolvase)